MGAVVSASWWYRIARIDSWARDKITTRGGKPRTHRPECDAEAKRAHALAALAARPRGWDVGGCVEIEVTYCRVTGHARDTDRVTNLVLDALRGVVYRDDNDSRVLASGSRRLWAPGMVDDRGQALTPLVHLVDGETLVVVRRVEGPPRAKRRAA